MGPLDLGLNVLEAMWNSILSAEFLLMAETGGYLMVDVRDAAAAIVALLTPGSGPRRYMIGGNFMDWDACADVLDAVTGLVRTRVHTTREELEQQIEVEAVEIMLGLVPSDDAPLQRDTGIKWRPFADTLRDTIAWMLEQGRLDPRWTPALA